MADCPKCDTGKTYSTGPYCRPCTKAYNKERLQKKRDFVWAYKLEKGCAVCGYNKHPVALELNHIDPTSKTYSIGKQLISISMENLVKELAKCEVLCANCHQIHTFENEHHLS